jgi:proteic killer suppression protein
LDISFKDSKLAKICNSEKALIRAYGKANARKIMRRLALLEGAETLSDVPVTPPTRRHELKGRRRGQYAIDVQQPYRLIVEPANSPKQQNKKGGTNIGAVTAIRIIAIEDYH